MEIIKKIEVKSAEAKYLINKKMKGGRCFITAGLSQLSRLYFLASQESIYPYIALIRFCGEMDKVRSTMEKLVQDFERVLANYKKVDYALPHHKLTSFDLSIDNPIAGELASLIEQFDRLSCLLWIANNLNLFKEGRYRYFKAVNHNSRRIMGLFKLIFALCKETDKETTIFQYLNNDPAYINSQEKLGEIKPALLYSALNLELLPRFSSQKRNIIIFRLKEMAGIKTAKRKS